MEAKANGRAKTVCVNFTNSPHFRRMRSMPAVAPGFGGTPCRLVKDVESTCSVHKPHPPFVANFVANFVEPPDCQSIKFATEGNT
jgi:hypothetical protein